MYIFTTKNLEYIRSSVRQLRYFKLHKTIVSSLKTSLFYALLQIYFQELSLLFSKLEVLNKKKQNTQEVKFSFNPVPVHV